MASDRPVVALFHGGETIEDFLDPLSLSFSDFRDELTGGWLFGYVEALGRAGVASVIVCISRVVQEAVRETHRPTGAGLWLVPEPRLHRLLRTGEHRMAGRQGDGVGGGLRRAARAGLSHAGHLLATPVSALLPLLREEGCGVLLCQEYEYPRFEACLLLGRRLGVPVFASFQGGRQGVSPLERPLRRWTVPRAAGLIVGPRAEADRLRLTYRVPAERIARIFNPLDLTFWRADDRREARRALGIPADAEVVVWHGRVELDTKGLDLLAEAWRQVTAQRPERQLALVLVGTGRDAPLLRGMLADRPDVRWRDEYVLDKREIRAYLSAGDVYAFSSRNDGFPMAVVEAMACRLPVVAARAIGGISDILEGGERSGGLMVPRADVPALAHALGRLLDSRQLRDELGTSARRRAEEAFSLPSVGDQLRRFIFQTPPGGQR